MATLTLAAMSGWSVVGGCAVILVFVFERDRADKEAILNDPARPDFYVSVRAKRRRYVPRRSATPLELATDNFVERLLTVVAYEEAFLRADERAQGALAAGAIAIAERRREEAYRAAEMAADGADDLYEASEALAGEWANGAAGERLRAAMADARAQRQLQGMGGHIDVKEAASREAWERLEATQLVTNDLDPRPVITAEDQALLRTDLPHEIAGRTTNAATATRRAAYAIAEAADGGDDDGPYVISIN